jgi:hypothetical protein
LYIKKGAGAKFWGKPGAKVAAKAMMKAKAKAKAKMSPKRASKMVEGAGHAAPTGRVVKVLPNKYSELKLWREN